MADDCNGVGVDILWQQVFEILFGLRQGQLFKNMSQVGVGSQSVGFGGLDQTEEGGTGCTICWYWPGPLRLIPEPECDQRGPDKFLVCMFLLKPENSE